jgi:hypothetical protein
MGSFTDSRKRIVRASEHRKTFADGWNTAIDEKGYTVSVETDGRSGVLRAIRSKHLEVDLSLELGEFFYQLRSALDNAVFEAAELQIGADVAKYEDRLYFPIHTKPSGFKDSTFSQIAFPDELKRWVESIQPYNISPSATPPDGWMVGLRILNDCARKDRHRRLHAVVGVATQMTGRLIVPTTANVKSVTPLPTNLLEGETKFLQFWYEGVCPAEQVYMDGDFTIEISVKEIPVRGPKLATGLGLCILVATEIVDKIESFYP